MGQDGMWARLRASPRKFGTLVGDGRDGKQRAHHQLLCVCAARIRFVLERVVADVRPVAGQTGGHLRSGCAGSHVRVPRAAQRAACVRASVSQLLVAEQAARSAGREPLYCDDPSVAGRT